MSVSGTNVVYATDDTTITLLTNNPPYSNYMVMVKTVWPFRWSNKVVYFTNTIAEDHAPD